MRFARRAPVTSGAALPFLRRPARTTVTPGKPVFGQTSDKASMTLWADAGTDAATGKLMFHRGLLGYGMGREVRDFYNMPGVSTFYSGTAFETRTAG